MLVNCLCASCSKTPHPFWGATEKGWDNQLRSHSECARDLSPRSQNRQEISFGSFFGASLTVPAESPGGSTWWICCNVGAVLQLLAGSVDFSVTDT